MLHNIVNWCFVHPFWSMIIISYIMFRIAIMLMNYYKDYDYIPNVFYFLLIIIIPIINISVSGGLLMWYGFGWFRDITKIPREFLRRIIFGY